MKQIITPLLALVPFFLSAQQFLVLGTDPSGDVSQPNIPDITEVAVKADQSQDSAWIRIKSATKIVDDWGFQIVIDTNEVPDDGKYLGSQNLAGNDSLSYDMKLQILNNAFFPPTHKILSDTSGLLFTQDINLSFSSDSLTLTINFALHHIGSDGAFNLMVGGASFDGMVRDNAPDSEYYSYNVADDTSSVDDTTDIDDSTHTQVISHLKNSPSNWLLFPNPAKDKVYLMGASVIRHIELLDMSGKSIPIRSRLTDGGMLVEFDHVEPGIYLLRGLENDHDDFQMRFVVEE